jgi:hypothetical protein
MRDLIERLEEQSGPSLSKREATRLIRDFYEEQTPNPGEPRAKVKRISIDVEEDDEGDYYWFGTIHDRDGTSVEFSMSDYYPESYSFDY